MTKKLVIATANQHKVDEIVAILSRAIPGFSRADVATMSDFDVPSPVEDGLTFAENALIKAEDLAKRTGLPALADDSGLRVDVLGGAPGIFSARWSGEHGNDRANLDLLLAQIADVPVEARGAQFVCAAALAFPDGSSVVEEGIMSGTLTQERMGEGGFGYDPVFLPDGSDITTAQMAPEEKNRISHRGRAMHQMAPHIAKIMG